MSPCFQTFHRHAAMSRRSYTVTRSPPVAVPPAEPTPGGVLPLSSIDKIAPARVLIESVHIYTVQNTTAGDRPVDAVRRGFAGALVKYYPLAGRIIEPIPREPAVDCTGEGIWISHGEANCTMEEVNYLEPPAMIPAEELLPVPPLDTAREDLPICIQVTQFACGGFTIGVCVNHLVFDGLGAGQFLNAVGEMARGLPEPTVNPVWYRDAIPSPPKPSFPPGPPPRLTLFDFKNIVADINTSDINHIKNDVTGAGLKKKPPSTFDVVTAVLFKSRAAAIDMPPETTLRLSFAASTRHLLVDVLPATEGYYGNCLYFANIDKTSEEITRASVADVVALIRDTKKAIEGKFLTWMRGESEGDLFDRLPDYSMVTVSDWSRLGLTEVDVGWGKARYVFPVNEQVQHVPSVIYVKPPAPKTGLRLVLRCVEGRHAAALCEELKKVAKSLEVVSVN